MMDRFRFPVELEEALKNSPIPFAVYQHLDSKAVTILLSKGFLELFGLDSYEGAMKILDSNMYRSVHPDDVARISDLACRFITEGGTYNAVYRNRTSHQKDYHIIHSEGKTVDIGSATVKSKFVCKLPSGITVDNYAARRAACSSAIRCS